MADIIWIVSLLLTGLKKAVIIISLEYSCIQCYLPFPETVSAKAITADQFSVYLGHFAWIPVLDNDCDFDFDGQPVLCGGEAVSLFQWLAKQTV